MNVKRGRRRSSASLVYFRLMARSDVFELFPLFYGSPLPPRFACTLCFCLYIYIVLRCSCQEPFLRL